MSGQIDLFDYPGTPTPKTPESPKRRVPQEVPGGFGSFGTGGNEKNDNGEAGPFPVAYLPSIIREMDTETGRVTQAPDALGAIVALESYRLPLAAGCW